MTGTLRRYRAGAQEEEIVKTGNRTEACYGGYHNAQKKWYLQIELFPKKDGTIAFSIDYWELTK